MTPGKSRPSPETPAKEKEQRQGNIDAPYRILDPLDHKPLNPQWLVAAVQQLTSMDSTEGAAATECMSHGNVGPVSAYSPAGDIGHLDQLELGSLAAREQLFCLDPQATYLNHGSYGATFKPALQAQARLQQLLEAQPVKFMETTAMEGMVAAVCDLAHFVGASPRNCAPVINATSAVNAVLASVPLGRGDYVLTLNTTYPAVKSTVARAVAAAGARVLQVELGLEELSAPDQAVPAAVSRALSAVGPGRVALAVLDHVVSFPPVILPIQQLVALCKQAGARVLVDGAHALGSLPCALDIPALGADYVTANCHKWLCCPKGTALLWVHPDRQAGVRPGVTSHGCGLGFPGEFLWTGTQDMTPWLAVPAALSVMRALGPRRAAEHNDRMVQQAAGMLRQRLEEAASAPAAADSDLSAAPSQAATPGSGSVVAPLQAPAAAGASASAASSAPTAAASPDAEVAAAEARAQPLPQNQPLQPRRLLLPQHQQHQQQLLLLGGDGRGSTCGMMALALPPLRGFAPPTAEAAAALHHLLRNGHNIEVPVICAFDRLWVRLSAQIYNRMSDYQHLADVLCPLAAAHAADAAAHAADAAAAEAQR